MNWSALRPSTERLAAFLGLMLVVWQPFSGAARVPSLLLLFLGAWMLWKRRIALADMAVKRLTLVFLLLFVPALLSIPLSYDPLESINVALAVILFYIVGLALLHGLATVENRAWLVRWLLVMMLFLLVDSGVQFTFGKDLFGVPIGGDGRVIGPFAGDLHLGLFLAVLAPAVLWNMAGARPLLALALLALIGMVAGLSGARTNVLFFFLSAGVLMTQLSWRHRALAVATLAAVFIASLLLSPPLASRIDNGLAAVENNDLDTFHKLDKILTGRQFIWETALHMVMERPITGIGANAFDEAYDQYASREDDRFRSPGKPYHAHHMYVAIAAETGVPGLAGLLAIVGLCAAWYLRAPSDQRRAAAPFAASLVVIAFPIQSQPVLYTIWWFPVVLLLLCGFLVSLRGESAVAQHAADT